ncbi:MAG: type II toxin-antitoxin system HicB family antitoxin [Pigmentiphaga sp.]|nr:type II toxin-antitoxin system HicB family antitoxin [Pigmentiphaga sp.]
MSNTLEYKGYLATIEFSAEDACLYGKVEYINDLIMFDGNNVEEMTNAFHNAIDDYLDFCAQRGKSPDQTFKGSFNVRTGPSVHRQAAIAAKKQGVSLNEFVTRAIERSLSNGQATSPSVSPT